jgi:hypothetical protein
MEKLAIEQNTVSGYEKPVLYTPPPGTIYTLGMLTIPFDYRGLDQDIIAFQFEDNTWLDVGHYPSYDPDGSYQVVYFGPGIGEGYFEDGILIADTRDVFEVARVISNFRKEAYDYAKTSPRSSE